jgi:hypothetical protein
VRHLVLTVPEIAFIAGTRAALGFGGALLLSNKMSDRRRRALGWSLLGLGLATTIPAARKVMQPRAPMAAPA